MIEYIMKRMKICGGCFKMLEIKGSEAVSDKAKSKI